MFHYFYFWNSTYMKTQVCTVGFFWFFGEKLILNKFFIKNTEYYILFYILLYYYQSIR